MDFDTERDPRREGRSPQAPDEEPRRTSGEPSTAEFTYTDPVQSFVATVGDLVTRPASFFAGIKRRGDFVNPLVFALVCVVISGIIAGLLGLLGALVGLGSGGLGQALADLVGYILICADYPRHSVVGVRRHPAPTYYPDHQTHQYWFRGHFPGGMLLCCGPACELDPYTRFAGCFRRFRNFVGYRYS